MSAQPLMPPDDYHNLIVHLLHSGGPLWGPGAKLNARNEPVPFTAPQLPTTLHPHPLNPGLGSLRLPWWDQTNAETTGVSPCPTWPMAAENATAVNPDNTPALMTAMGADKTVTAAADRPAVRILTVVPRIMVWVISLRPTSAIPRCSATIWPRPERRS